MSDEKLPRIGSAVSTTAMPRELVRYQQTGSFHFLTFSRYRRRAYLDTGVARDLFEDALELMRRRYVFAVAGYAAMPEHVHLLVSESRKGFLSRAVQALKLSVSVRQSNRPFWQVRYHDFNLHTHEKHAEKLRYMHRNPVVRGSVARREHWAWSSYLHYAAGVVGTVEIESDWTAWCREGELPEGYEIQRPDESGLCGPRSQKRDLGHQLLLGMWRSITGTWGTLGCWEWEEQSETETLGCSIEGALET